MLFRLQLLTLLDFCRSEIKLEYNTLLNAAVLKSLFASQIIPKRLTRLEITQFPSINPIRDIEALAVLLQRGLQLVSFLKLHLTHRYDLDPEFHQMQYTSTINDHPEHHLCNIVRELGQKIKALDLAIPFACNRIFVPLTKRSQRAYRERLELPQIPKDPVNTLPQHLIAAGYRYRRLIFYSVCRDAHKWDEMAALSADQGDYTSWQILLESDEKAMWFVGGCLPVEFSFEDAMQHPFNAV